MNTRRRTLAVLGAGALTQVVALPAIAQAQGKPPEKPWRIGFLVARTRSASLGASHSSPLLTEEFA